MFRLIRTIALIFLILIAPLFSREVTSQVFFDFNTSSQKGVYSAFHVRRAYLEFREKISDKLAIRITTDAGTSSTDGRINVYIKMANITWNTPIGDFIIGPQPTNYFGPNKKTWGYRFIEKLPGDLHGFDQSADLGVSWKKYFNQFLIHFGAYNGTGFKKPDNDQHKRISLLLSQGEQNLQANSGRNWGGIFSFEPYSITSKKVSMIYRLGGFAGYSNKSVRLGGEIHIEQDEGLNHQERILAFYTNIAKTEKLSLISRIDIHDSSISHPEMRKNILLIALSYSPLPTFQISPNYRYIFFGTNMLEPYWVGRLSFNYQF